MEIVQQIKVVGLLLALLNNGLLINYGQGYPANRATTFPHSFNIIPRVLVSASSNTGAWPCMWIPAIYVNNFATDGHGGDGSNRNIWFQWIAIGY